MPRVCVPSRPSLLARFASAEQGNIAVIFAIALIPVLTLIGAAIDYGRAVRARTAMQGALDSAALMVAKDLTAGTITAAEVESKARVYFQGLYVPKDAVYSTADIHATYTAQDANGASNIVMTASGFIYTQFMQLAGFQTMDFSTQSTSRWGDTRMRVALVLDTTGSMSQDNKMPNLQTAAKTMIDQLSALNHTTGDVYISLVPFVKDVNVAPSNFNASWINWTEWEAEPPILVNNKPSSWGTTKAGSSCPFTNSAHGFTCMDRPATLSGARGTGTIPSSGTYAGYICPSLDSGRRTPRKANIYYNGCYTTVTGATASCGSNPVCTCSGSGSSKICHLWRGDGTPATAAAAPSHSTWNGCVTDRDQNYDTTNDVPTLGDPSKMFYAEQYASCPEALTPMSNSWTSLKSSIDSLSPAGNTDQAIGIAWGWFSLSQTPPLSAPAKDTGYSYQDYLVIVSDGMNTQNRWYNNQTSIDNRQKILCDNVKKANITVFAIQINTSTTNPDPTSAVLQYCATNPAYFQMITSASQTAAAFQNVTTQITRLHVAQ